MVQAKKSMPWQKVALRPVAVAAEDKTSQLPDHLLEISPGQWALWRCAGLRGAGFPAEDVLKLSAPDCSAAADALLYAEETAKQAAEYALNKVNGALDALRQTSQFEDREKRDPLVKGLRTLKAGKIPSGLDLGSEVEAALDALRLARANINAEEPSYRNAHSAAVTDASREISDLVCSDRFREAVLWQNQTAYRTAVPSLLNKTKGNGNRGSKQRQYEELFASYLQRYCVKNDTIGFFGPVGWAYFDERQEGLTVRSGSELLAKRNTYFEGWCLDALARKLSNDARLKPWIAPRRLPYLRLEGNLLQLPLQRPTKLSLKQVAALERCNGQTTAKEIAQDLLTNPSLGFNSESEVYELFQHLHDRELIQWMLLLPVELHPEIPLRRALERIDNDEIRRDALDQLNQLELARLEIADAAGSPDLLDRAIENLNSTFTKLTGMSPTRSAGENYAARTLVYEDCRRDVDVRIGSRIIEELREPFSLLLAGARWFTYETASLYGRAFARIYSDLTRETGSSVVDAVSFWGKAQPILFNEKACLADSLLPEFQKRWSEVLALDFNQRRARYCAADLQKIVREVFDAPGPGWKSALYHSPDVMIAAESPEAISAGDYELVLGELHLSSNTLRGALFIGQHPAPDEVHRYFQSDLPEPRLLLNGSKSGDAVAARTVSVWCSPGDYFIETSWESSTLPSPRSIPISELVVEDRGTGLEARTRDGRLSFDLLDSFGPILSQRVINNFKLVPSQSHTPRINFDRLIVHRETWRFPAEELAFAYENESANRFLAARRWARSRELPRFVFVKVPVELKPFYLDFDSPIFVDNFSKMVRRTMEKGAPGDRISLSEMVPRANQTWLPDAQGRRYTSELRIVAVDLCR